MTKSEQMDKTRADLADNQASYALRECRIGVGRVVYAPAGIDPIRNERLPDGWALPGGGRTTDYGFALQVAKAIDEISQGVRL